MALAEGAAREAGEVVVASETAVAVEAQGVAASVAGAVAVVVEDSADGATQAQAVSHEAAAVAGVASAGDGVRKVYLSRCAFLSIIFAGGMFKISHGWAHSRRSGKGKGVLCYLKDLKQNSRVVLCPGDIRLKKTSPNIEHGENSLVSLRRKRMALDRCASTISTTYGLDETTAEGHLYLEG